MDCCGCFTATVPCTSVLSSVSTLHPILFHGGSPYERSGIGGEFGDPVHCAGTCPKSHPSPPLTAISSPHVGTCSTCMLSPPSCASAGCNSSFHSPPSPQRALHSILASRTVLHLKEMSAKRLIEYDSNGRPPPPGAFQRSGSSGKSNEPAVETYVLSEFQAAPAAGQIQTIDSFSYHTQTDDTGGYLSIGDGAGKARSGDDELYGYTSRSPASPPPRFEPLRRQRTPEWSDAASGNTNHSATPLQGGLKIFVQRQQTQHV